MRRLLGLALPLLVLTAAAGPGAGAGALRVTRPHAPAWAGRVVEFRGGRVLGTATRVHARLYRTGYDAAEPTLGFTKSGAVFVEALDGKTWPRFPEHFIRSTDGGRTWKDVTPTALGKRRHSYSEDPYLYVDPRTSRIFATDYLLPCYEMSYSDDNGRTWTTTVTACDIFDHQSIFAG